jgi:hypothetical protein
MSDTQTSREPSNNCTKAKRAVVTLSVLLILLTFAGVEVIDASQIVILPIKISNPSVLTYVVFAGTIYYTAQYVIAWALQNEPVRTSLHNAFDFRLTMAIATTSSILFVGKNIADQTDVDEWLISLTQHEVINSFIFNMGILAVLLTVSELSSRYGRKVAEVVLARRRSKMVNRNREIFDSLTENSWHFVFDAKSKRGKSIRFCDNGEIGEGRNQNEFTWRIKDGYLEVLNSMNEIYSRFRFNKEKMMFEHTNDDDTLSLPDQYIYVRSNAA